MLAIIIGVIVLLTQNSVDSVELTWGNKFESRSKLGVYSQGAVTSNGQKCSNVGMKILKRNGSAMDSAIATLLCEEVVSFQSMGLGGGFLMTIWDSSNGGNATFLDARETAPAAADENMFHGSKNHLLFGGKAVAVPGALKGYWEAHQKYGKLPWSRLFKPAINLCKNGFLVSDYLAKVLASQVSRIHAEPTMAEFLIDPTTNRTWMVDDTIKRPKLAETLTILSKKKGVRSFYGGEMGKELIKEIKSFGGIMTINDLKKYKPLWRTPITSKIRDYTMYTAPPPGSGVLLSLMMNILSDIVPTKDEKIFWQRIVETFKWAYARRTGLGDPAYEDISELVANLTSVNYANDIRQLITDFSTSNTPEYYGALSESVEDHGTAHICVLAPDGSAVSVTSSINHSLGAMRRSKSTGIIFNAQMGDFSAPNFTNKYNLPPSPGNFIAPGKRPQSSMSPTIVVDENNRVRLVIGAAGGTKSTTAIATAMILNLLLDYNIKQAIDARRIHHQLLPMEISYEKKFNETILSYLREIGHGTISYKYGGTITAIAQNNGQITANSDYRRRGSVSGF